MNLQSYSRILEQHIARYPEMELTDAFKLVFQSEFGAGHLISDKEKALEYLKQEWEGACPPFASEKDKPMAEDIGGGFIRLNFRQAKNENIPLAIVNQLFMSSAEKPCGSLGGFKERLQALERLVWEKKTPFSMEAFGEMRKNYMSLGRIEPFGHTEKYRANYSPSYRLITSCYAKALPIASKIHKLLEGSAKRPLIAALDGRTMAGKSTLADLFCRIFPKTCIIEMNDFFLPTSLRTIKRLAEHGGNIHYERFAEEVLKGLESNTPFSYQVFDSDRGFFGRRKEINPKAWDLIIVEGCYSLRPEFRPSYDIKVFCDVPASLQSERLRRNCGEKMIDKYTVSRLPMEENYITYCEVAESADFVYCCPKIAF